MIRILQHGLKTWHQNPSHLPASDGRGCTPNDKHGGRFCANGIAFISVKSRSGTVRVSVLAKEQDCSFWQWTRGAMWFRQLKSWEISKKAIRTKSRQKIDTLTAFLFIGIPIERNQTGRKGALIYGSFYWKNIKWKMRPPFSKDTELTCLILAASGAAGLMEFRSFRRFRQRLLLMSRCSTSMLKFPSA